MYGNEGHNGLSTGRVRTAYLFMALLVFLSGCSAGYRYRILSFFFDGVPRSVTTAAVQSADSLQPADSAAVILAGAVPVEPQMVIHPPYKERDCAACHDESKTSKEPRKMPGVCYQCHDDFGKTYKVLHGPVAGGLCTACHNPHLSKNKGLMIRSDRDICLFCHESSVVMKSEAHTDITDTKCTECHNPHGGEDRYVLR
jgi:predicted CXXCH cytochrome family protein